MAPSQSKYLVEMINEAFVCASRGLTFTTLITWKATQGSLLKMTKGVRSRGHKRDRA